MDEARKEKVTEEHKVIDEAIRDRGDGYTVFSIVSARFLKKHRRKTSMSFRP
jgi:hypothetical protein